MVMRLVRDDVRPSHIVTREAIENAAAAVAASGGSTNGVLHLLAIAHELDIPFTIDEFDAVAARTPIVASLKPGGQVRGHRHVRCRRRRARRPRAAQARPGARGRAQRRRPHAWPRSPTRRSRRPVSRSSCRSRRRSRPPAGSRSCAATSRPRAASSSWPGHERLSHSGPARVFDSEEDCFAAVKAGRGRGRRRGRDPLRGAGGRPGHARDAARHRRHRRRGPGRPGGAGHRRPLLGRDPRADGRARHARGGPRRADRDRP